VTIELDARSERFRARVTREGSTPAGLRELDGFQATRGGSIVSAIAIAGVSAIAIAGVSAIASVSTIAIAGRHLDHDHGHDRDREAVSSESDRGGVGNAR
jgi:hypothetical protein